MIEGDHKHEFDFDARILSASTYGGGSYYPDHKEGNVVAISAVALHRQYMGL